MRFRLPLLLSLLFFASSTFAIDRWVLISGTVNNFHTDARVFNPTFDKDISVNATFHPTDGSGVLTGTVTVPKRQMKVLDDVTTGLFNTTKLGAILFSSADTFEVTSRIYAISTSCPAGATATLGQFGPGVDPATALAKGALLQLKANGNRGQAGTFRTNIGALNPSNSTVAVTWTLFDKNSALVSTQTKDLGPFGVLAPSEIRNFLDPKSADLSDAWISYSATAPILTYASVLDNSSEDQTFIPAVEDRVVSGATQRWVLIAGTVSNFHTDARVFNPTADKDIQVTATFHPADASGTLTQTFAVPRRQMRVLDDVTTFLFATDKLGAIHFAANDTFEVTSRIYAISTSCPTGTTATLGQFGPGVDPASAKAKGTLLQLKANGTRGQAGTFRTNIGALNPSSSSISVTWTLYDKNSAVVSTQTKDLGPFGVIAPSEIRNFLDPKTADLSDAWVSYSATAPLLAYASVLDNASEDQTFIPAVEDKGIPLPDPPPQNTKEFFVTLEDFSITFSPGPTNIVKGDRVTLHIEANSPHTFLLFSPTGQIVVSVNSGLNDRTFTVDVDGLYQYTCNNASCGVGHVQMNGSFTVGNVEPPDTGRGY